MRAEKILNANHSSYEEVETVSVAEIQLTLRFFKLLLLFFISKVNFVDLYSALYKCFDRFFFITNEIPAHSSYVNFLQLSSYQTPPQKSLLLARW